MNSPIADPLATLAARAQAEGLLPPDFQTPPQETRPWPVVLLTALGAWLAALPLLAVIGMLLGELVMRGVGPYLVGALLLAAAFMLLRAADLPVFVEQLAIPAMLSGGGALGFGLFRDLPSQAACAVLCGVALAFGASIARPWLRVLLGAVAAGLMLLALAHEDRWVRNDFVRSGTAWVVVHSVVGCWIVAMAALRARALHSTEGARAAGAIESIGAGWLLTALAALATMSGMTFMVGGATGSGFGAELGRAVTGEFARMQDGLFRGLQSVGSMALAALAAGCVARAWPSLRRVASGAVAVVLVLLCAVLPMLGAVLLALAVTATTHRWRLAGACAVAAAWIVGSFYYQLTWPLAYKAVLLVMAGAVLGALAWLARDARGARAVPIVDAPAHEDDYLHSGRRPLVLIAVAGAVTLFVANVAIWQKEDTIAHGQPVYVALAPADPRSLMQGDYMQLNFNVPGDMQGRLDALLTTERPHVVARRDARGVAALIRIHDAATPLAADEFPIELTPKNGRWIFVTDAYYFREGDADRFEKARFGEFRVAPNGRALLVRLADQQLKPIE